MKTRKGLRSRRGKSALLIDCEEDRTPRVVLVGMLREVLVGMLRVANPSIGFEHGPSPCRQTVTSKYLLCSFLA